MAIIIPDRSILCGARVGIQADNRPGPAVGRAPEAQAAQAALGVRAIQRLRRGWIRRHRFHRLHGYQRRCRETIGRDEVVRGLNLIPAGILQEFIKLFVH
jgi:hypothetical protein